MRADRPLEMRNPRQSAWLLWSQACIDMLSLARSFKEIRKLRGKREILLINGGESETQTLEFSAASRFPEAMIVEVDFHMDLVRPAVLAIVRQPVIALVERIQHRTLEAGFRIDAIQSIVN